MSTIPQVGASTTFFDWRTRTNDIIDLVNITKIGTPAKLQTLEDIFTYIESAGVHSGCSIGDLGTGSISVTAGEALLRITNDISSELVSVAVDADPIVGLVDNDINYIYLDYNAGSPIIANTTVSSLINNNTICLIGIISREGTNLTILEATAGIADRYNKLNNMLDDTEGFKHVLGGTQLTESGTNTRKLLLQSGAFYRGLNKFTHSAYDTNAADTFEYYYRDGVGGWTENIINTVIDNANYDDGTGTLATITVGKFVVNWVYLKVGSNIDELYVLYGQGEYDTITEAQTEVVPSTIPPQLDGLEVLIGRIILAQASSSLDIIETALGTKLVPDKAIVPDVVRKYGDAVSFLELVNTTTTNELHVKTYSADHIGFRPAPLGVADVTDDFFYDFTNTRWVFDKDPYVGSNVIWNAGNDGAGSGLDADLWDGGHKTISTATPSGGADKDVWFEYTA